MKLELEQKANTQREADQQQEQKRVERILVKKRKGLTFYGFNTKNGQLKTVALEEKKEVRLDGAVIIRYETELNHDVHYFWSLNAKNAIKKVKKFLAKYKKKVASIEKAPTKKEKITAAVDKAIEKVDPPPVVIVGDMTADEIRDLIQKYYDDPPAFNDYNREIFNQVNSKKGQ